MQQSERFGSYIREVCGQIRWKKARALAAEELEAHLEDQRDALLAEGVPPEEAEERAVLEMGDGAAVGQALDRVHRPRPQPLLLCLTGALLLLGMLGSILQPEAGAGSLWQYPAAAGVLLCFYFLDFTFLAKRPLLFYGLAAALTLLAFHLSADSGPFRFMKLGPLEVNLAVLSIPVPLACALLIYAMRRRGIRGILLCWAEFLPLLAVLCTSQPYAGAISAFAVFLALLSFAVARDWFGVRRGQGFAAALLPAAACGIAGGVFWVAEHRSLLDGWLHPGGAGSGYLFSVLRDVADKARFFGPGLPTERTEALEAIAEPGLELLPATLLYEYGWIFLLAVAALLAAAAAAAVRRAVRQGSMLGSLVALSAVLGMVFQALFALADNLGFGLFDSIGMPFFTQSSAVLLINAAVTGLLLSVFRSGSTFRDRKTAQQIWNR